MRNKRYSNVTFTKRVDHNQGLRPVRAVSEPAQCTFCGAIYSGRRWRQAGFLPDSKPGHLARLVTCPACSKIKEQVPGGIVHVAGPYYASHAEEIRRCLENEAARAAQNNPLARIMKVRRQKQGILVLTTTDHLAQRLGQALESAFHGTLRIVFSHENKFTRVYWERG